MKGLFKRLLGEVPQSPEASEPTPVRSMDIESHGHGLVSIPALDYFGPHAQSPNDTYHLLWLDRNPQGTVGGSRTSGHGRWSLHTSGGSVLAKGRLERPQDGHVADTGRFILSDWLFGDGLKGRLHAFEPDGSQILQREFSANLASSGLSRDGRYAICQTANSPGSPDSCRYFLFDLDAGEEMASWEQETGWANGYEFDPANGRVYLGKEGAERVAYAFDGTMIDRNGWQQRRVAAGDLRAIRSAFENASEPLPDDLRSALFAGLDVAETNEDPGARAKALRVRGEIHERAGEFDKAIDRYEKALMIDPQVGVSRRLSKLQRMREPVAQKTQAGKKSRYEKQAERLGIDHEVIELNQVDGKLWRYDPSDARLSVEGAALQHYRGFGWEGAASEGGLILTLIKAASFAPLPERHADTFVEALYAQNVAFEEDRHEIDALLRNVGQATRPQIEANWARIAASTGSTPRFYPSVRKDHVLGLFESLGPARLKNIAAIFATAPYDLRAGWPDLTLWRDGEIRFVEVKAPGDSMHAKQVRLISTVLVPLGHAVAMCEVRPKSG